MALWEEHVISDPSPSLLGDVFLAGSLHSLRKGESGASLRHLDKGMELLLSGCTPPWLRAGRPPGRPPALVPVLQRDDLCCLLQQPAVRHVEKEEEKRKEIPVPPKPQLWFGTVALEGVGPSLLVFD